MSTTGLTAALRDSVPVEAQSVGGANGSVIIDEIDGFAMVDAGDPTPMADYVQVTTMVSEIDPQAGGRECEGGKQGRPTLFFCNRNGSRPFKHDGGWR